MRVVCDGGPTEMMDAVGVWLELLHLWIQGESNATATMMALELLLAAAVNDTDCLAGPEHDVRAPVPAPFTFAWTAQRLTACPGATLQPLAHGT